MGYIHEEKIEDFLFCQLLKTSAKAGDVRQLFLKNMNSHYLVRVCTDGTPIRFCSKSRLVTVIQQKNTLVQSTYCLLYKQALVSKILQRSLCDDLLIVIKSVKIWKQDVMTCFFKRKSNGCPKAICFDEFLNCSMTLCSSS